MASPLDNVNAGILGMYAAIKIFRHNDIDPHKMVDAIVAENPFWGVVDPTTDSAEKKVVPATVTTD